MRLWRNVNDNQKWLRAQETKWNSKLEVEGDVRNKGYD